MSRCRFHSARQMAFFRMGGHSDKSVMSIRQMSQMLAEYDLMVCSSVFFLVSEKSLSGLCASGWTVPSETQK